MKVGKFASFGKSAIGIIVVIIVGVLIVSTAVVTVGAGDRGVLMTFGKVSEQVLTPGIHFKIPFAQSVYHMDTKVQVSESKESAASRDLQDVYTTVAVNWSVDPKKANWVYKNIGTEKQLVRKTLIPAISNAVKSVTARYKADDLIAQRDQIRAGIEDEIKQQMAPYNVTVSEVNITNFSFSKEYAEAIERKQVAQQNALKAKYDLQRVEVEARQKIASAQGQAKAQRLIQSTLTDALIRLRAIEKWNGIMPQAVGGQGALPMIGLSPQDLGSAKPRR